MTLPIDRPAAPLRAVDDVRVERRDGALVVRATKTIDAADPYLAGHFPGFTIFPGVFTLEALRQAVMAALDDGGAELPEILRVRSMRFLAPLLAGDELTLEAVVMPLGQAFAVDARCWRRDGVLAAQLKAEVGRRERARA